MDWTPGGWETWSWNESLFAGAARYYEQGRTPYAPGLANAFGRELALDGRGRLLDAGCGPGTVTLPLSPLFETAVGLDPDPGMLACASRAAARRGITNVIWMRERAEALPADLGRFRSRPRPTMRSTSCGTSTWAATGGPGRASATPRPEARTRYSGRPGSCPPRQ